MEKNQKFTKQKKLKNLKYKKRTEILKKSEILKKKKICEHSSFLIIDQIVFKIRIFKKILNCHY